MIATVDRLTCAVRQPRPGKRVLSAATELLRLDPQGVRDGVSRSRRYEVDYLGERARRVVLGVEFRGPRRREVDGGPDSEIDIVSPGRAGPGLLEHPSGLRRTPSSD